MQVYVIGHSAFLRRDLLGGGVVRDARFASTCRGFVLITLPELALQPAFALPALVHLHGNLRQVEGRPLQSLHLVAAVEVVFELEGWRGRGGVGLVGEFECRGRAGFEAVVPVMVQEEGFGSVDGGVQLGVRVHVLPVKIHTTRVRP